MRSSCSRKTGLIYKRIVYSISIGSINIETTCGNVLMKRHLEPPNIDCWLTEVRKYSRQFMRRCCSRRGNARARRRRGGAMQRYAATTTSTPPTLSAVRTESTHAQRPPVLSRRWDRLRQNTAKKTASLIWQKQHRGGGGRGVQAGECCGLMNRIEGKLLTRVRIRVPTQRLF